ncbi:MAG: hypothetical protein ACHQHN_02150 [Sphingobacteriales bacterium]
MRFIYLILLILAVNLANGSVLKKTDPKPVKAVLKTDTATIQIRHFDTTALTKYSKLPAFKYNEIKESLSLWDRFWMWFWHWLEHLFIFRSAKGFSILGLIFQIVEILLLLGGVAALIYFILKSAGIDVNNIMRRKSASVNVPYSEFFEDINSIDFDAEIENAVAKHNYRFAVRLLYLKCLKQLSNSGLIEWKIDKTNYDYINEIKDVEKKTLFGLLTRQFEYVWYGDFLIDGTVYDSINLSFTDFNKRAV